jgi:hypothetical protein
MSMAKRTALEPDNFFGAIPKLTAGTSSLLVG